MYEGKLIFEKLKTVKRKIFYTKNQNVFFNIFKYALPHLIIFKAHKVVFCLIVVHVGYPGLESNLGRQDGNPSRNRLDHPDSE